MHLLHTALVSDGLYPPVGDIDQVYHPEQAVLQLCFMHFCCSLPGGSAPRGPTYSTVLEHHTGISARCDDQHVFFVHMGDCLQEKSCRTSPEHLKVDRYPICSGSPPSLFP